MRMPAPHMTGDVFPVARSRMMVLVATLVGLGMLLSGCGAAQPDPLSLPVTGGSDGQVGDIVVRDAMFVHKGPARADPVYRPGDTVNLQVTIVNEGDAMDRLLSLSSPIAAGGVIDGSGAILGHHALTTGDTEPVAAITLPDTSPIDLRLTDLRTAIRAGLTYPVVFTFARAGDVRLQLRVDNPDEPREDCPLPPNGRAPQVFTAPLGKAPVPPTSSPPDCSSLP